MSQIDFLPKIKHELDWYKPAERNRFLQGIVAKRNGTHMRPHQTYMPCFICGHSRWCRRPDLFQCCEDCRSILRELKYKSEYYGYIEKRRQVKREQEIKDGIRPRRKRDRSAYNKEWRAKRSDWQKIKKRAEGRTRGKKINMMTTIAMRITGLPREKIKVRMS